MQSKLYTYVPVSVIFDRSPTLPASRFSPPEATIAALGFRQNSTEKRDER